MRQSRSRMSFLSHRRATAPMRLTFRRLARRREVVQKIDYEEWGKIHYRNDYALFANGPGRFPVTFFHLRLFFQKAVKMHVIDAGDSRQIVYDQSYFDMPAESPARDLPKGAGFAGLRVQEARDGNLDWRKNDWVAFLGAAYFRSIGGWRNTACLRAASRLTSQSPISRKSSPTSPTSISSPALETRSLSML